MSDLSGIGWIAVAGLLFGSQFIPSKYCPKFKSGAYNISMAMGILAGSAISILALGLDGIALSMFALAFLGGLTWVVGNYLLIMAVAKAGMARSFIVINSSAVLSFLGGVAFLGELTGITIEKLALIAGAVGLVMLGAFLVSTTTPAREKVGQRLPGGGEMMRGIRAAFLATIFFSIYNVMIAYVINTARTPTGTTFASIAPGVMLGAVIMAFLARGGQLRDWRTAPPKWHMLAVLQGLVWAAAMVCIMFGWKGTGIAMGTPVQVGTQTLVSSMWGIIAFGELRGSKDRGPAYARYTAGAALTVVGIIVMTMS
jgi:glucose uptake protein GlcU